MITRLAALIALTLLTPAILTLTLAAIAIAWIGIITGHTKIEIKKP